MNFLSIDIGGTNLKYALINEFGQIIIKGANSTNAQDKSQFLESLYKIIDLHGQDVQGIGFSLPGVVDPLAKKLRSSARLAFLEKSDFFNELQTKYKMPVTIENDSNCAALAEKWQGSISDEDNAAMMVLGTGIGSSIFLNGQLVRGNHFAASEPSFMIVDNSQKGIKKTAALLSAVSMIEDIGTHLNFPNIKDGKRAFSEIMAGEEYASRVFTDFCDQVALLMYNIQSILDLDKFAIGGGISSQPLLIKQLHKSFEKWHKITILSERTITVPKIVSAHFYNDANLIGAIVPLLKLIGNDNIYISSSL
ncbi:ROK family protein [Liquorilactobacillus mali]|uniref:ROK family protein n=1 Tax=Liquorilactobacillus mali TaxID=1618 RepID=UPI0023502E95|nr:ROK family protein [Liquorilactobacillus mali]MDC7952824.1 ROK family protein [Liquorilactobacillus mali]